MAAKKSLTTKNLEVLGVERLAGLLHKISEGDAVIKRRLIATADSRLGANTHIVRVGCPGPVHIT